MSFSSLVKWLLYVALLLFNRRTVVPTTLILPSEDILPEGKNNCKKQQNKDFFPATNQQSPTTNKLSTLNQQVYVKHSRLKNQFDVFQIV